MWCMCGVLVRPLRAQLGWSTAETGAPSKAAPSWVEEDADDTDRGALLRREGELPPLTGRLSFPECVSPRRGARRS